MVILYMYAELMGYNIPVLKELVSKNDTQIHLIHWNHKKLTVYKAPEIENVIYYNRSELSAKDILKLAKKIQPDIAYVPNWYDKGYLNTCNYLRRKNIPVVSGLDNQWQGTLKQRFGILLMRLYLKRYFSHVWVAGPYQFEFAKRLGFKKDNIIFNLYSADIEKFNTNSLDTHQESLKFLFVGRLEEVKGVRDLLKAWSDFPYKENSSLTIIGDGSLQDLVRQENDVNHLNFLQPQELAEEVKLYNCFILPSLFEPYGVVIHELACAGMPIIASNQCGAAPVFIIPDYNGYIFKAGDYKALLEKMIMMHEKSNDELIKMKKNAFKRSKLISPEVSAASFLSVLN